MAIVINATLAVAAADIQMTAMRAQGPGGQHVNKVSSAIQLRFDIGASSLPDSVKRRLLARADRRISAQGVLVLKAQRFRTQEKNREDALARLVAIIAAATDIRKPRRATRPTRASKSRRLDAKTRRGARKQLRGNVRRSEPN